MPSRRLALVLVLLLGCGPQVDPGPDAGEDGGAGGGAAAGGAGGGQAGGGTGGGSDGGSGVRRITALALTPATLALRPGAVSGLTATATFSDGTQADVSGTVQWNASPAGVVSVAVVSAADNLVSVTGVAPGTAQVTATTGAVTSNAATLTVSAPPATDAGSGTPAPEARAVWVTRFAYNSQAEVEAIIDKAAASGFNLVYFQIRGNGDAYYRSTLVPWAKKLTGTLGKDPGWDPLQVAITRAHARGLQLHAYWNVFAAWPVPAGCATSGTCTCTPAQGQSDSCVLPEASAAGAPEHFLRANPQTLAVNAQGKSQDTEYYWFTPGDPAVRAHLVAVARELLTAYAVDGLHLDRVRYPGTWASYDAASNAAYNALPAPRPSREDWQRANVNATVGALYDAVKQLRPQAVLSASVWGIYKVLPGCSTSQGYSGYFQDSIAWMKQGLIDAINPMIYWDLNTGCTDWAKHLDVFLAGANGRHVIAGMHALDANVPRPDRLRARIDYARQVGAAGTTIFASTYLDRPPADGGAADTWATFRAPGGPYAADAGVPPVTWR